VFEGEEGGCGLRYSESLYYPKRDIKKRNIIKTNFPFSYQKCKKLLNLIFHLTNKKKYLECNNNMLGSQT
jgi:hypothetical protein